MVVAPEHKIIEEYADKIENLEEVKEYFEENGMDVDEMSMNELEEASEVFALPNGQYLIVEG